MVLVTLGYAKERQSKDLSVTIIFELVVLSFNENSVFYQM